MTQIKICGLSRQADIDAANIARPDYIGFVFAESRRRVTPEQAAALKSRLRPGIQAVGVFVNAEISLITQLTADGTIDFVQLHGNENSTFIANLRRTINRPIIQAFRVVSKEDILAAQTSSADYVLLDSGLQEHVRPFIRSRDNRPTVLHIGCDQTPPVRDGDDTPSFQAPQIVTTPSSYGEGNERSFNGESPFGGTGACFDWELVRGLQRPFFLAGGIGLDNISAALSLRPFAIDVSSGAETAGLKDSEKMQRLTEIAHRQ
jgi:phosphoribosylanthranilate isomerase